MEAGYCDCTLHDTHTHTNIFPLMNLTTHSNLAYDERIRFFYIFAKIMLVLRAFNPIFLTFLISAGKRAGSPIVL